MARTQIIAEPGVPQIVIAREFAAPRELLFRAHIEPQLLVQWLGPRELTMTVDRLEARDGGRWRYTHRDAAGQEYAFHGVFHGTPSSDGIVQTFEFEGAPGHVSLQTLTFEDQGGKTLLRTNAVFQSVEDRDGMLQSGMEQGVNDSMERLDELVARLAPAGEGAAGVAELATLAAEGGQAMDQTNLDIYGSAPIPWSRALAQLEAGAAKASWLATTRPD
jgi:uncharacterized protein YndB with AHSA1/START domain